MSDLNQYVKNNSKFLSIQDGETVTMVYKGFEIIADRFNPGKQTVSYLLQDPDTGKAIPWTKSSNKVAAQMAKIEVGDTITIMRIGEGMGTVYKIKAIKERKVLSNVQEPDETPF
jgi:hypothetical protein